LRKANSETKKPKRYNARVPESTYKLAKEHLFSVPQGMPMLGSELNSHAQNIHSALEQLIAKNNNFLPFAEYMQFCLYEPQPRG